MATKRQVKKQESKLNAMKAKAAPVVEKVVEKTAPAVEKAAEKVVEETKEAAKKVRKSSSKKRDEDDFDRRAPRKASEDKDMIAAVKKAWTKSGRKIGDIKTMTLYVKPEEAAVYYVINTTENRKCSIFNHYWNNNT